MPEIKITIGLGCGHRSVSSGWKPLLGSYLSCLRCQGQREVVSVTTEPARKLPAKTAGVPGQGVLPWFEAEPERAS